MQMDHIRFNLLDDSQDRFRIGPAANEVSRIRVFAKARPAITPDYPSLVTQPRHGGGEHAAAFFDSAQAKIVDVMKDTHPLIQPGTDRHNASAYSRLSRTAGPVCGAVSPEA